MNTLFSGDNVLAIWGVVLGFVCFAMYAEQKYKWAKAVGAALICLVGGMILPAVNIVPTSSPVYGAIWSYVVPVAIPLVLFDADIRKIGKQCGRLVIMFIFPCVGTILGALLAAAIFQGKIPEMAGAAAMFVGSQTGGSMNLVVASQMFNVSDTVFDAVYLADTLTFSITLFTLTLLPSISFLKKFNGEKYANATALQANELADMVTTPSQAPTTNFFEVAKGLTLSIVIVVVSTLFADWVTAVSTIGIITQLFGQKYLVITLLSVLAATFFPKQVGGIQGTQKLGIFLMYIFMVAVSIEADLKQIIIVGPALICFSFIVFCGIILASVLGGKLCKFSIEELAVAANAALGGPPTAAAMAGAKGWKELVTPAVLLGVLGYIVGNYCSLFAGNLIQKLFC